MQTMAGGALGGGTSSAVARALGARKTSDAEALVLHAILIALIMGLLSSVVLLSSGATLYRILGGQNASLLLGKRDHRRAVAALAH